MVRVSLKSWCIETLNIGWLAHAILSLNRGGQVGFNQFGRRCLSKNMVPLSGDMLV